MVASTGWATLHSHNSLTGKSVHSTLCGKIVEATFLASKTLKLTLSKVET